MARFLPPPVADSIHIFLPEAAALRRKGRGDTIYQACVSRMRIGRGSRSQAH